MAALFMINTWLEAGGLSLQKILEFYGMLCLFCLPLSLLVIIFIYRRYPDVVGRMNDTVDKVLGGSAQPDSAADAKPTEPAASDNHDKTQEEENEEYGTPTLHLFVGDKYKCVMSAKNRRDIGGTNFGWAIEDPFVGEIKNRNGIFVAKHAGNTCVESEVGRKPIYFVHVMPVHKDWFAAPVMKDVTSAVDINDIKVRNIKEKITKLDTDARVIEYKLDKFTASYEYGRDGAVKRAALLMPDSPEIRTEIGEKIQEYMSAAEGELIKTTGVSIWIHKSVSGDDEFVDYVAFMMKAAAGGLYLGVGECWRYGATEDEIAGNPLMVVRSFRNVIHPEDYPGTVGADLNEGPTKEESDGRKEMEAANNAGKKANDEATSGNRADGNGGNPDTTEAKDDAASGENSGDGENAAKKPSSGAEVPTDDAQTFPEEAESETDDASLQGDMESVPMDDGPDYGDASDYPDEQEGEFEMSDSEQKTDKSNLTDIGQED